MNEEPSYIKYKLDNTKALWRKFLRFLPWLFIWYPLLKMSNEEAYDAEKFFIIWLCAMEGSLYALAGMMLNQSIGLFTFFSVIILTIVTWYVVDYKAWLYLYGRKDGK